MIYDSVSVVAALTSVPFLQLNLGNKNRPFKDNQFEPAERAKHLASVYLQSERFRVRQQTAETLASLTNGSLIASPPEASLGSGVELFPTPDNFEEQPQKLPTYNISNAQKAIRHPADESPSTTKGTPNVKDVPETSDGTLAAVDKGHKKPDKEQTKTTPKNKRNNTQVPTRRTPSREAKRKLVYTEETEETEEMGDTEESEEEKGRRGNKKRKTNPKEKGKSKGKSSTRNTKERKKSKETKEKDVEQSTPVVPPVPESPANTIDSSGF